MLHGLLAGVALIVAAVFISAVTFGAYGWGLFVATPFLVGVTTAYIANRRRALGARETFGLVMAAGGLGTVALVAFALEGLVCIILVLPLAAGVAAMGAGIGRSAALARNSLDTPLMSLALLPAFFALEAAMPPAVPIDVQESIDISAPPSNVWRVLTDGEAIHAPPGLVGSAGLAYPIRGRIAGGGVGAERVGEFSTGIAHERITLWEPERRLAFEVLSQPPSMEEMSPYRRVHAPHVVGYFDTAGSRFELQSLPGGRSRLTLHASHVLRIDPVLYWEPIARWAVGQNASRVLEDAKAKSEAAVARGAN